MESSQTLCSEIKPLSGTARPRKSAESDLPDMYRSKGFLNDLRTGRWMLIPCTLSHPDQCAPLMDGSLCIQVDASTRGALLESPALAALWRPGARDAKPV